MSVLFMFEILCYITNAVELMLQVYDHRVTANRLSGSARSTSSATGCSGLTDNDLYI
ncbi:hypothetical protein Hanom_Chr11g01020901 [Helianthus anomalus]